MCPARSPALPAPPRVRPVRLDCCFDQGSGWQEIPTAQAFEGEALRFSATGAEIDPVTGVLKVPTGRPQDGAVIRVTASNAGGSAGIPVRVAVEDDGSRAETAMMRELAIDGVVFRFAEAVPVGRFISGALGQGDPFVIGPVTVESYSPAPAEGPGGRALNGAMLNPRCREVTGFDRVDGNRKRSYDPRLNAGLRLPLQLAPGDRLVVGVSRPKADRNRSAASHFVVLTCLAEAPFEDAFRPPYSGPDLPIWRLSDLRLDRLPALPGIGRLRGPAEQAEYERRMGRFIFDIVPHWDREHLGSSKHPPLYGRDLCHDAAEPLLWVITDRPLEDKVEILIGLVQRGIDQYGVFRSALDKGFHPWRADGGHHSGRKAAILIAGHLLDDPGMLSVTEQGRSIGGNFQEDDMTFHVTPGIVAISNSEAWRPPYDNDARFPKQPYTDGMIGMPDWRGKAEDRHVNAAWTGHPYRVAGNHNTQHAQVLAILAMGLRGAWNNEAYFDYHMRFCAIQAGRPDPWRFRGGRQALYDPVVGSNPGQPADDWERRWHSEWAWRMLMAHAGSFYRYPWD